LTPKDIGTDPVGACVEGVARNEEESAVAVTTNDLSNLVEKLRESTAELEAAGDAAPLMHSAADEIQRLSDDGDIDQAGERVLQLWRELTNVGAIRSLFSGVRGITKAEMPSASLQHTEELVVFVQKLVRDIPKSTHRHQRSPEQLGKPE
jgi:hypothetical protein